MRRLAKAELLKLTTTRTFGWLALALVLLQGLTLGATLAFAPADGGRFPLASDFTQRTLMASGGMYGIIVALLGIIGMTGEYRHGTITSTLLVTPSREQMVAAKVAVYGLAGLGLGLLSSSLTLAVALPGLAARKVDLALTPGDVAAILLGGLLYVTLSGVFGVGVGAVVRNQIAALAAVLVLFFIVESVLVRLSPEVARWLPGQAGSALYFPGPPAPQGTGLGATVLRQPMGGVVFAAYAAVLCFAGAVVSRSNDIT